jgi:hypothetical protein
MERIAVLIRAAPVLLMLAVLAILAVGLAHGWQAFLTSLILAVPVLVVLLHGLWRTREVA